MAPLPAVELPITANPAGLIAYARTVAKHLNAMADDLEAIGGDGSEPVESCPHCTEKFAAPTREAAFQALAGHVHAQHRERFRPTSEIA